MIVLNRVSITEYYNSVVLKNITSILRLVYVIWTLNDETEKKKYKKSVLIIGWLKCDISWVNYRLPILIFITILIEGECSMSLDNLLILIGLINHLISKLF